MWVPSRMQWMHSLLNRMRVLELLGTRMYILKTIPMPAHEMRWL